MAGPTGRSGTCAGPCRRVGRSLPGQPRTPDPSICALRRLATWRATPSWTAGTKVSSAGSTAWTASAPLPGCPTRTGTRPRLAPRDQPSDDSRNLQQANLHPANLQLGNLLSGNRHRDNPQLSNTHLGNLRLGSWHRGSLHLDDLHLDRLLPGNQRLGDL
ncbi:hypothetical protein GCM10025862_27730 [Arsenicicoccus piscis]|uniref:Pentapeptide repeat-containing protein n=1 Tax=Arsenicicoccus piscis TaxID=673954 RepID=A0ABQ6HRF9_9MICO|nr:hypothetical protein GCM10025862_27730 [Arsenicicoccus piscis]